MTTQVSVDAAQVHFSRDRRDARQRGCDTDVHVPIAQIAGAWLVERPDGSADLRVLPHGASADVPADRDPFSAHFTRTQLPAARGVLDRLQAELAATPEDRAARTPVAMPLDPQARNINRLLTISLWGETIALGGMLLGLVAVVAVAVFALVVLL